jgi:hypothetical protein
LSGHNEETSGNGVSRSEIISVIISVGSLFIAVAAIIISILNQNSSNSTQLRIAAESLNEQRVATARVGEGTARP